MNIMFDVGANWGTDSLDFIRNNNDWVCFAFEPTPQLFSHLVNVSASFKDRYFVYPYAISDFVGKANFNVAGQSDWGCSSLLEFSDNLDKTWPGRTDFVVTENIEVDVISLKYFIENIVPNIKIEKIDRFHCDTQGNDLKVLKGMAEYVSIIQHGVIEVPQSTEVMLYKNQHSFEEAVEFLQNNGFKISNINSQQNELNLCFDRKEVI
jgi:FkbM family methyltransferase